MSSTGHSGHDPARADVEHVPSQSRGRVVAQDEQDVRLERALLRAERAELELDNLRREISLKDRATRTRYGYQLLKSALDVVRVAVWIAATWLPLTAVEPIARHLAGEETSLQVSIGIPIAFSISLSVLLGITFGQSQLRKRKLKRQRERMDKLEAQLAELRRKQGKGRRAG